MNDREVGYMGKEDGIIVDLNHLLAGELYHVRKSRYWNSADKPDFIGQCVISDQQNHSL